MPRRFRVPSLISAALAAAGVFFAALSGRPFALLQPAGSIAAQQLRLMYVALGLMLLIVIPVFILTIFMVRRYREGSPTAEYDPEWEGTPSLEALWWGLPTLLIAGLGIVIWRSSHALDPERPIASDAAPLRVEVIALQWKWLFLYPDEGVASLNELRLPAGRPVQFEVTADAPMNSLWIPQLGGQIYAMPGMSSKLHLIADRAGSYRGLSANISGEGFADMHFQAVVTGAGEFDAWAAAARDSPALDRPAYDQLAQPSSAVPPRTFALSAAGLYHDVMMQYMGGPARPAPENGTPRPGTPHGGMHGSGTL